MDKERIVECERMCSGGRRRGQESERRGDGNRGAVAKTECAAALDGREMRVKENEMRTAARR